MLKKTSQYESLSTVPNQPVEKVQWRLNKTKRIAKKIFYKIYRFQTGSASHIVQVYGLGYIKKIHTAL